MQIDLPWPPSVNTYWRNFKGRVLISAKGRAYRKAIAQLSLAGRWRRFGENRLKIEMRAFPPDRRRRDLDNLPKAIFDSLEEAGIFADDEQIDAFSIERCHVVKKGRVVLSIEPIGMK